MPELSDILFRELPPSLQPLVRAVGSQVTSEDIARYEHVQDITDRSHWIRSVVSEWKDQQGADRSMRMAYAKWLMIAMGAQVAIVNLAYFLIGLGLLSFPPWTTNTFIISIFAEIVALVHIVAKYLFRPASDNILELGRLLKRGDANEH